jgi:hypothetical protein
LFQLWVMVVESFRPRATRAPIVVESSRLVFESENCGV